MAPRCDEASLRTIERAYTVAEQAHGDQRRTSGEAYITHPLKVAAKLACLNMDAATVAAALMHDVIEDTGVTKDALQAEFGEEVTTLVDSVTKLSKREALPNELIDRNNRPTDRQLESLRKMLLGTAKDVRVVLIKLADRLHNMETLEALKPEKQKRIARETLEIYAPLANRLGIWEWKQQLEELGFRYGYPEVYHDLAQRLEEGAQERNASVDEQIRVLRNALAEQNIFNVEITGRAKQIYSIYRKMQRKKCTFDQIMDLRAIRVIIDDANESALRATMPAMGQTASSDVSSEQRESQLRALGEMQCYNVLFVVHRLWKPLGAEFDDYIAKPKDNHYQSLHTAVIAGDGKSLEVQIRTNSMHKSAEFGVAAHWLYKEKAALTDSYQRYLDNWREAIRALSSEDNEASDVIEMAVKDAGDDHIFCFTPKGKAVELPVGSTVLDFAFHIHTELGYKCRGARVNGTFQAITYRLKNDDQIDVITRQDATPSRDWLQEDSYLVTVSARNKVKQWFRRQDREQNITGGKEAIEREMKRLNVASWMKLDDVYKLFKVDQDKPEDFLEKVGWGTVTMPSISARIMEEERRRDRERSERSFANLIVPDFFKRAITAPSKTGRAGFCVQGVHDVYAVPATCCRPTRTDPVIGYITRGQGVKVHRMNCTNVLNADPDRLIEVSYVGEGEGEEYYPVQFAIMSADRPGLINEITGVLSGQKINIVDFALVSRDPTIGETHIWVKIELTNKDNVNAIMSKLRQIKHVFDVKRVNSQKQR